jgi:hypothetical protein
VSKPKAPDFSTPPPGSQEFGRELDCFLTIEVQIKGTYAARFEHGLEALLDDVVVWPACGLPIGLIVQQCLIPLMGNGVVCDLGRHHPAHCATAQTKRMLPLPCVHPLPEAVGVAPLMGGTPAPVVLGYGLVPGALALWPKGRRANGHL